MFSPKAQAEFTPGEPRFSRFSQARQAIMSTDNAEGRHAGAMNPQALRLEELARILSVSGVKPVSVKMLEADIDDGAPVNADGTVNLVQYAAWLVREMARGD